MVRKIVKMIFFGMMSGCFVLTMFIGIAAAASGQASFSVSTGNYIRSMVCAMIVGIGFFVPTLIYSHDEIPMGMRVLIHMGIGLAVYFICSFVAGWIPVNLGRVPIVMNILAALAVAWIIWFVCYSYTRHEAKRINEKIRKKR